MPFVECATGAKLHYEQWNAEAVGIPVVVLHGMLGTATVDLEETNQYIANLGFHVIAPTLRGYGESTPKPRNFPMRFYERDADDVMAFLDALDIQKAHLIGYSDGGEIALLCAGKFPNRWASAACWGAVGYFGEGMRLVAQNPRVIAGDHIEEWEVELHGIDRKTFGRDWVRSIVNYIDTGGDVSLSFAPNIQCPLLLMLGETDRLNPREFADIYLQKVGYGTLEMFAGGHACHTEQTEPFRRVLSAFLLGAR